MKKGSYDLGRKPVYLVMVVILIAVAFLILYSAAVRFYGSAIPSLKDLEERSGGVGIVGTTIVPVINIHDDLLGQYLLTSPYCFVFYDEELQKYHPGMLDAGKMNAERLGSCLKLSREKISLKLSYADKVLTLGEEGKKMREYFVLVIDEGRRYPGSLEVMQ